jgi:hypothetical protein
MMKWFLGALAAVLVMTSVSYGVVTVGYTENPVPGPGYRSFNVQATGVGINTLAEFRITGNIHQVWAAPGIQSEWLHDPDGYTPGVPMDSYVIFGTMRMPMEPYGTPITTETILGGGVVGLGTLNNWGSPEDAYLYLGTPSTTQQTKDLLKLVVPNSHSVSVEFAVYTATYNPNSGFYDIITEYDFFGANALQVPVPEPSTLALLVMGVVGLVFTRRRKA